LRVEEGPLPEIQQTNRRRNAGGIGKDCTMAFATTPTSALNPWLQILAALEKKVIRQSFETWLKPTRFSHAAGRKLYVRVPSPEFQHIGDKYGDLIQEAIDLHVAGVRRRELCDRGRGPVDSAAAQGWRIRAVAFARAHGAAGAAARTPEQGRFDWSTAAQLNRATHSTTS
jgi:chromosomal replication initiator protein